MSRPPQPADLLFGRKRELRVIEERLDSVSDRGSALLVRGEAGVGKTAILEAAKLRAASREMSLLAATGVPSETSLPFAGLYELLRPIVERTERLPGPQQDALRAAFGLADVPAAELFMIALGALDLLSDFASEHALLLVVDDAQWLDRSTTSVLAFIARRLQSEPCCLSRAAIFPKRFLQTSFQSSASKVSTRLHRVSYSRRTVPIFRVEFAIACCVNRPAILWRL